jgi:hypothetical protein
VGQRIARAGIGYYINTDRGIGPIDRTRVFASGLINQSSAAGLFLRLGLGRLMEIGIGLICS